MEADENVTKTAEIAYYHQLKIQLYWLLAVIYDRYGNYNAIPKRILKSIS